MGDRALLGGCSCDTPATHWKQQNEPRQGCSYTLQRDRGEGGGAASAPLSSFSALTYGWGRNLHDPLGVQPRFRGSEKGSFGKGVFSEKSIF